MNSMPTVYFHADDYGMTPQSSARIADCWREGCLSSVSVLPNGRLDLAPLAGQQLRVAAHLNLVEGKALSPSEQVSLLTDSDGSFCRSFGGLLLLSLSLRRKQFRAQLYLELRNQILAVQDALPPGTVLCLDSHQHTHMIPLIFHTLLAVVRDLSLPIGDIRISAEPIGPFVRCPGLYRTYRPVNLLKQWVLKFLYLFDRPAHRRSGIPAPVFCGILFSGHMDAGRVSAVLPHFLRIARKKGRDLELLFHPGGVAPGEPFFDPKKESFHPFYLSQGRHVEYEALHRQYHFPEEA